MNNPFRAAGTAESFRVCFLEFDHKDQRWSAECQVGEDLIQIASQAGMSKWYVVGHIEVEVPLELCQVLGKLTINALEDYQILRDYKKAVGEYPAGVIQ